MGYTLSVPGSTYILSTLSAIIYAYGGSPFLKGVIEEMRKRLLGMMTLIGVALTTAVFSHQGRPFFWELATLTDVMLLGHWVKMRSVLDASRALEKIAEFIPRTARKVVRER